MAKTSSLSFLLLDPPARPTEHSSGKIEWEEESRTDRKPQKVEEGERPGKQWKAISGFVGHQEKEAWREEGSSGSLLQPWDFFSSLRSSPTKRKKKTECMN